jgi:hypothetical protein
MHPSSTRQPPSIAPRANVALTDENDSARAVVVGTEHGGHFTTPGFPVTKLVAMMDVYRPDLILVEVRPEAFARGEYEDGPIEMSYITLSAQKRGIQVAPIDWWRTEDLKRSSPVLDPTGEEVFQREFSKEANALDQYASFEELNSPERAKRVLAMRNAQTRLGTGDGYTWQRRQAWFHHQASEAVRKHGARRIMAFVGFMHRPELALYFTSIGVRSVDPRSIKTDDTPANVPLEVLEFWKQGAVRLKSRGFEAKAESWERAIALQGDCCAIP